MTGKHYKNAGKSLQGAALFYLALMNNGGGKLSGANDIIKATFRDLGVTESDVEQYIKDNRTALEAILAKRASAAGVER